jgi:hypothetical protein
MHFTALLNLQNKLFPAAIKSLKKLHIYLNTKQIHSLKNFRQSIHI